MLELFDNRPDTVDGPDIPNTYRVVYLFVLNLLYQWSWPHFTLRYNRTLRMLEANFFCEDVVYLIACPIMWKGLLLFAALRGRYLDATVRFRGIRQRQNFRRRKFNVTFEVWQAISSY